MNKNIRINIIIDREKTYECFFSNELSLKENIDLLSKIIKYNLDDKIIVTYLSNRILDPNIKMEEYNFINGQILYLY